MNKKIKIISINPLQIELLEDYKKGEVINISQYFDQSSDEFNNLLVDLVDKKYHEKLKEQKLELNKEFADKLNQALTNKELELNQNFINEKNALNKKIDILTTENKTIERDTTQKLQEEFRETKEILNKQIDKLAFEKNNIAKETKLEVEKENIKQINELNKLLEDKDHELEIKDLNNKLAVEEIEKELTKKYEEQLHIKEKEISELKHQKNLLGTKALGEELERHCENEIRTKLIDYVGDDSICMYKTSTIDGSKADFVVKFLDPSNINDCKQFKVVLEMKNEAEDTKDINKKTNDYHIKKLIKDAEKENADIAILVSELEKQDSFLFRRINNKEYKTKLEIYIIRPSMLIYLLSLLRLVYLKYISIQAIHDYEFEEKEKILKDFEDFKDKLINVQIKNMNKQLEEIINSASTIEKQAKKIRESAELVVHTHVEQFKNKIENYNIANKIINKLEKIDAKKSTNILDPIKK